MVPQSRDGYRGTYSYLKVDTTRDSKTGPGAPLRKSSSLYACPSRDNVNFDLKPINGEPITAVILYVDGHRVGAPSGTVPRRLTIPGTPGTRSHRVRLHESTVGGLSRNVTRTLHSCSMSG
jgi:hypothetical protein